MFIELIASSFSDALAIEKSGADRIELVTALSEGGLTPSYGLVEKVTSMVSIPVNVMIRPHSRNFVYNDYDLKVMLADMEMISQTAANGYVLGTLDSNNNINTSQLECFLKQSGGKYVTFHRAIDYSRDPVDSVRILSQYPEITTILTSGGNGDFDTRMSVISNMNDVSKHINILVGSGVNFDNLETIHNLTRTGYYHAGTAVRTNRSQNEPVDVNIACKFVELARNICN